MPYDKTPTEMKGQKGMMMKSQQPMMMKGQQPMMMKDKGQPMMKYGGGPKMSAELAVMPLIKDTTIDGRASSIVNAGARSRMSGQPQMGHKGSPTGMHGPLHEVHKGKGGMPMYDK